ncbi:hypothetical protein [Kitasatospora aureofaciens]|uniref:hypothetical protein n=1 Tax=Kitasatospora aureofaciens TaxID=1894 RepID=UPI0038299977
MPHLSADRLLAAVDPLPLPLRLREVARTAAALAATGHLSGLLAELDGRGPYERRLAALAALAGRRPDHLITRLTDPDPVVRRYARRAVRELPFPDDAIEQAALTAPTAVRDELIRTILATGRTAVAERLVPAVRQRWGAAEAGRLLPVCSPEFVARELPGLAHAITFSSSLGRRHPGAVLDEADRQLDGLPYQLRIAFWRRHALGLAAAAAREPARVLDLLERHPARQYFRSFPGPLYDRFAHLAAVDPERTARVLLAVDHYRKDPPLGPALARRLLAAPLTVLAELAHRNHADHLALLRQLPPARRAALYDAVAAIPGPSRAWYSERVLAALPAYERQARARARLAQDREDLAPLTFLPVAEARPQLLAETRTADAWDRGYAWGQVVLQAERSEDPDVVGEVLVLLERLRNEQDPVRREALASVATVPPALFGPTAAAPLERLTDDALTARDCSPATRSVLCRLACAVLGEHAGGTARDLLDWAVRAVERTVEHTGAPVLGFPRGREEAVAHELLPALERSAGTRDATLLLAFTESLGPGRARIPVLTGLLERVLHEGGDRAFEQAAAHLLSDPATRAKRVARLLTLEPSAVALPPLQTVLTRVRTDLLDPLLAPEPTGTPDTTGTPDLTGTPDPADPTNATTEPRFAPAPLDLSHADRWLPRQQRAAAEQVARTADDPTRSPEERAAALRSAARIPGHGPALLRRYADSADPLLAEAALAAMPWTEHPAEALPVLLAHAGDDRARVALYAAGRAARFAPSTELAPALARIAADPAAKVTSRKQAVRLAAAHLPLAEAAEVLEAAYRTPEQHHDVRVTAVEQIAARLADLPLWNVLADAAAGSPALKNTLVHHIRPHELPAEHRPRFAELIARLATDDDLLIAAPALNHLTVWSRYAPHAVAALACRITALDEQKQWKEAAGALRRIAASEAPHPLGGCAPGSIMADTLSALIEAVRAGEPTAPGRDHPARQRIVTLTGQYWGGDAPPEVVRATGRAMAALLMTEPSLLPQAVPTVVGTIDLESPALGDELAALAAVLADRPVLAANAAHTLRMNGGRATATEHALAAARRLAADGRLASGLFAAALVTSCGPGLGWPTDWRTELHALRRHPQPDVRDVALSVWTAQE